jgi:8-oxo-dGTP pyrophosphatase MutT (NUDIX family)
MSQALFHIGVSGHQQLGDEKTIHFVTEQFASLLKSFHEQARQNGQEVIVYAALAVGADRLFVKSALALDIAVEAVIPCSCYEQIFSPTEREEYDTLLSQCKQVHRLPFEACSDEAYLEAGRWVVEQSDVVIVAWNGYPAGGKGGTADVVSYARFLGRSWVHLHTRLHTVKHYLGSQNHDHAVPRREFTVNKQVVYQGDVLTVYRYRFRFPGGQEVERDIVERPESVLVLPVGQKGTVLLIEEADLGAGVWQLTIPGGKVKDATPEALCQQAALELREETGYRAGRIEKLVDIYGHPGYVAHKVHVFVASDLEWDPLEMEDGEEILVKTLTLDEALASTQEDYRVDPEAALALWLYAGRSVYFHK